MKLCLFFISVLFFLAVVSEPYVPNGDYSDEFHILLTKVDKAWEEGYTGEGQAISFVTDSVMGDHESIKPNFDLSGSNNYCEADTTDPFDGSFSFSVGTYLSSIAAGSGDEFVCGVGAAPKATIYGQRVSCNGATTDDLISALSDTATNPVSVYQMSIIPTTCVLFLGCNYYQQDPLVVNKIVTNTRWGRKGYGSVHVIPVGDHYSLGANVNYATYVKLPEVIAVGSVSSTMKHSFFSNSGYALTVTAPGGGLDITGIHLSLINAADSSSETSCIFSKGTQPAASVVSGVVSMILESRPTLTPWDVQGILIETAQKVDVQDEGWKANGAGFTYSPLYGFGVVNAKAALERATTFESLSHTVVTDANTVFTAASLLASTTIPDNNEDGLEIEMTYENDMVIQGAVVFRVSIAHLRIGDIGIEVWSPSGTYAELVSRHTDSSDNLVLYPLAARNFYKENAKGVWKLKFTDKQAGKEGKLVSVVLEVTGILGDNGDCQKDIDCNGPHGYCKSNNECECYLGYSGVNCEFEICPTDKCNGHGTCDSNDGSCSCEEGYAGETCCTQLCPEGKCNGHGTCDLSDGSCSCEEGYAGDNCCTQLCPEDKCGEHGTCDLSDGSCSCEEGYSGDNCETNACSETTCANEGTCDPDTGKCQCKDGWIGDTCEEASCPPDKCKNNAFCDTKTGICRCDSGWIGDTCEEVACPIDKCLNGGTCSETTGECSCIEIWTGPTCTEKKCQPDTCNYRGECDIYTGECDCNEGWEGAHCQIEICPINICAPNGKCSNDDGKCYCSDGYSGDHCENDLCQIQYERCNEDNQAGACNYTGTDGCCKCKDGWGGPSCQENLADTCTTDEECHNGGKCLDSYCQCAEGWEGNYCDDDSCRHTRCHSNGFCLNDGTCECDPGWDDLDCTLNICEDDMYGCSAEFGRGECAFDENDEVYCKCNEEMGYTGKFCHLAPSQTPTPEPTPQPEPSTAVLGGSDSAASPLQLSFLFILSSLLLIFYF
ncbi:multiple epidermal growth factor-like domains protein [Anaeramoeba flamelloides]|uniref:Multiple epidermal growth factor-like domains protein n=1 Tax=Anaeramoeba flamelloides TaxID=1746091 RepID=A0AAV8AC20_9EUKA|nr:multiple epidermal growth factor-like domains protein [Anaeramoeba flamelloides]